MSLNASQLINNLKKSFNRYVANELSGDTVNYDLDPFDTTGLSSWYSVRYTEFQTEPVGIGDFIDVETNRQGRIHVVGAELSAWCRHDEQRAELGDMLDKVMAIAETASITLYDFADPENPVSIGKVMIKTAGGAFTPVWSGSMGGVLKSSGDIHADHRLKGYVQKITLTTIAEV